jgi:hypothetical protein
MERYFSDCLSLLGTLDDHLVRERSEPHCYRIRQLYIRKGKKKQSRTVILYIFIYSPSFGKRVICKAGLLHDPSWIGKERGNGK